MLGMDKKAHARMLTRQKVLTSYLMHSSRGHSHSEIAAIFASSSVVWNFGVFAKAEGSIGPHAKPQRAGSCISALRVYLAAWHKDCPLTRYGGKFVAIANDIGWAWRCNWEDALTEVDLNCTVSSVRKIRGSPDHGLLVMRHLQEHATHPVIRPQYWAKAHPLRSIRVFDCNLITQRLKKSIKWRDVSCLFQST